jgi:hypothetical protein
MWINNPWVDCYMCACIDLQVQWWLYIKFQLPADILEANESMGSILKTYSLNGIKSYNLCKPY